MNALLSTLFRNAGVATPVADAHAYLASRAKDNADLGDITKLNYGKITRKGNKWTLTEANGTFTYGTEAEARAHILRVFW